MVNDGFNETKFFWQEIKGQGHLQNDERLVLKRHFVDHLYKEENAKGPNVELCETPQVTLLTLEEYYFPFSRNDFNQLLATPQIP